MTFRDWFSARTSDFFWACFSLFIVVVVLWFFGSFFLSLTGILLIALAALLPLICLLIPIFLLYLFVRGILDFLRRR